MYSSSLIFPGAFPPYGGSGPGLTSRPFLPTGALVLVSHQGLSSLRGLWSWSHIKAFPPYGGSGPGLTSRPFLPTGALVLVSHQGLSSLRGLWSWSHIKRTRRWEESKVEHGKDRVSLEQEGPTRKYTD
ncbi:hypothetical protein NHX12_032158 [Muraenolepis orangiensis]|uniref:Uncharacterized protein n=1 Tax=Muraenolepis orangiensis TaxID=630683 RepID=A0A9Q0E5T6_9TELE|nr:hypothetical protein NHX12_032158 [Muraenolepis orangiensis]